MRPETLKILDELAREFDRGEAHYEARIEGAQFKIQNGSSPEKNRRLVREWSALKAIAQERAAAIREAIAETSR